MYVIPEEIMLVLTLSKAEMAKSVDIAIDKKKVMFNDLCFQFKAGK